MTAHDFKDVLHNKHVIDYIYLSMYMFILTAQQDLTEDLEFIGYQLLLLVTDDGYMDKKNYFFLLTGNTWFIDCKDMIIPLTTIC